MKQHIIYILLFLLVTTGYAQNPERKTPPPLGQPKNLQLPAIQRFELSNGIKVIFLQKMTVPSVQVNLMVLSGSLEDTPGKAGLSSITFDLIDEGAGQYDALQLADEIEYLGAQIQTYSARFSSGVHCSTPTSKIERSIELMSDIVLRPKFEDAEVDRVRKLRLNGLLQDFDEPTVIASRAFDKMLFDQSLPYGKFADEASLKAITKNDIVSFYQDHLVSSNCTFIVVGAVQKDQIAKLLEKYFAGIRKGTITKSAKPASAQVKGRTIYLVDKPGAAQSVIRIGRMSESRSSADYYSMVVLNTILGGSFTSRLNTNLRETHGYSYGAASTFSFWPVASPFIARSSVQTDVTGPALQEFFNEFNNIRKPMPEEDFIRGKNYEALGFAGAFETNSDIAGALEDLVLYQLPDNYFNTYVDKVLAVTKKSVESSAKKYVVPDNMLIVIVGDRSKVEQEIRKLNLGTLTTLSVEDILGKKPQL